MNDFLFSVLCWVPERLNGYILLTPLPSSTINVTSLQSAVQSGQLKQWKFKLEVKGCVFQRLGEIVRKRGGKTEH